MITQYYINKKKLIIYFVFLMVMGFFNSTFAGDSSIRIQIIPDEEGFLGEKKSDLDNLEQHNLSVSYSESTFGADKSLKGTIRELPSEINEESGFKKFGIKNDTFMDIKDFANNDTYTTLLCKPLIDYLKRKGLDITDKGADLQIYVTITKIGPSCFSEYPPITEVVYKVIQDKKQIFSGSFSQKYDCNFHLNPFHSARNEKQVAVILGRDILKKLKKFHGE